jgi:amino acid adenylation domain-containing protein
VPENYRIPAIPRPATSQTEVNSSLKLPLTSAQRCLLTRPLSSAQAPLCFRQDTLSVFGDLEPGLFKSCWVRVTNRHDALRASFHSTGAEEPFQILHETVPLHLAELDWSAYSDARQDRLLSKRLAEERERPFDLATPPLMRLTLVRRGPGKCWLTWCAHSLVLDPQSAEIILGEILRLYDAGMTATSATLDSPINYSSCLKLMTAGPAEKEAAYWRQHLSGVTVPTMLPGARNEYGHRDAAIVSADQIRTSLPAELCRELRHFMHTAHLTLSTVFRAAWGLLLSRYSWEPTVIFGATANMRGEAFPSLAHVVGPLTNTVPVRIYVDEAASLLTWLQRIQAEALEPTQFAGIPHFQIAEFASPGDAPLFESLLSVQDSPSTAYATRDGSVAITLTHEFERTQFPLSLSVTAEADSIDLVLSFETGRFSAPVLEWMMEHLIVLLSSFTKDPPCVVGELSSLGSRERRLITKWSKGRAVVREPNNIVDAFSRAAERCSGITAVEDGPATITFQALLKEAQRTAASLVAQGVQTGDLIGVNLPRSAKAISVILGVLFAGCAYVGLDVDLPSSRLRAMIDESRPRLVISAGQQLLTAGRTLGLAQLATHRDVVLSGSPAVGASSLAYVVFTSGTTGRPKGMMIEHGGLLNYAQSAAEKYTLGSGDRVLVGSSISVDWFASEIYPPLISGATAVLRAEDTFNDIQNLLDFSASERLSVLVLPTALWHQLVRELSDGCALPSSIRAIDIGGERVIPRMIDLWHGLVGDSITLMNGYGPSEVTIEATSFRLAGQGPPRVKGWSETPIGRPLPNVCCHVLDDRMRLVPVGAVGELYIGGAGVARGYIGDPESTKRYFLSDPFCKRSSRMYRSGDLVRWLPEGYLEYLGRADRQVKLRGHRIELAEIEAAILAHPDVREVYVVPKANSDEEIISLAGYVVTRTGIVDAEALSGCVRALLPSVFVPSEWVGVPELPRTSAGKVDLRTISRATSGPLKKAGSDGSKKDTILEGLLAEVFGRDIDMDLAFFPAGGNSLFAMRLLACLRRDLHVEVSLRELFEFASLRQMATVVARRSHTS